MTQQSLLHFFKPASQQSIQPKSQPSRDDIENTIHIEQSNGHPSSPHSADDDSPRRPIKRRRLAHSEVSPHLDPKKSKGRLARKRSSDDEDPESEVVSASKAIEDLEKIVSGTPADTGPPSMNNTPADNSTSGDVSPLPAVNRRSLAIKADAKKPSRKSHNVSSEDQDEDFNEKTFKRLDDIIETPDVESTLVCTEGDGAIEPLRYQEGHAESIKLDEIDSPDALALYTRKADEEDLPSEVELINKYLSKTPTHLSEDVYWRAFVEVYYAYKHTFNFPSWIDPTKMRDLQGRSPMDPSFNMAQIKACTSLKQSTDDKMHFTPAMVQFWEVKAANFDRIIFFKLGKFYEIFYTDACIVQSICDLKWMGNDEKAHVGFPESSLHYQAQKVVDHGLGVIVVEQMETPQEMSQRSKSEVGVKPKAVRREICEVYSQGTLAHHEMIGPDPRYLISLFFDSQVVGASSETAGFSFVLADVAGLHLFYGHKDDQIVGRPELRTLLAHVNPREVLTQRLGLCDGVRVIIANLVEKPPLIQLPAESNCSPLMAVTKVRDVLLKEAATDSLALVLAGDAEKQSQRLKVIDDAEHVNSLAICFNNTFQYLERLLLLDKVAALSVISDWGETQNQTSNKMYLDSACVKSLEILQSQSGEKGGSLFENINLCATAFGSRLLRRWLIGPLMDKAAIDKRLDTVSWLVDNSDVLRQIRQILSSLPDLERLTAKASAFVLQSERGAVYFTETIQKRIRQFLNLMEAFCTTAKVSAAFLGDANWGSCQRLRELLSTEQNGGCFPDIKSHVTDMTSQILFEDSEYKPCDGADAAYDSASEAVNECIGQLNEFLQGDLWDIIGVDKPGENLMKDIKYVTCKFSYEVEVPDKLWHKILKQRNNGKVQLDMTSTRNGYTRFLTPEIRKMTYQLTNLQAVKQNCLFPFMQSIFKIFYAKASVFERVIQTLAEVDVYAAFAHTASTWVYGPYTRPIIHPPTDMPFIRIKEGAHPILAKTVEPFRSNDFSIGTDEERSRTLLITGPNMGGKSTLARQVALLVILAQIGSFVPAVQLELSPLDRVFTRIGARDAILEGKSTFFVELEETLQFLKYATPKSLGIIDEFGRGTSIEEGSALAYATIKYIAEDLQALCLFSTHFQDQLGPQLREHENISFYHMTVEIDEDNKDINFLYKFRPGVCPKSHGLKVAALAGIAKDVLESAAVYHDSIMAQSGLVMS